MTHAKKKKKTFGAVKSIYIDVPREELWKITAQEFGQVDKWISGVNHSTPIEGSINNSTVGARTCDPSYKGFKETTEELIMYNKEEYTFAYKISEGLPGFVESAVNTWSHDKEGNGTKIAMNVVFEVKGLMGSIMKNIMRKKMETILTEALEELKVYAETGEQHPRKKAAMAKYEKEQEKKANKKN